MHRYGLRCLILSVALFSSGSVAALSLTEAENPAEFPPNDYAGRQYVDSRGCMYVRAGFDGNVKWVPRVTRQRKVICGQNPTFAKAKPAKVAPAPKPAKVTNRPAPVARKVVAAAPKPAPVRVRPVAAPKPLPAPVVEIARAPHPAKAGQPGARGCAGMSAVSQRYTNPGARCGPQSESPTSGVRVIQGGAKALSGHSGGNIRITGLNGTKRVVPVAPKVPNGYRPVWQDGRLNPYRGVPTYSNTPGLAHGGQIVVTGAPGFKRGDSHGFGAHGTSHGYDLAWTKRSPHLLFDRRSGLVVGHEFPHLQYPNTDMHSAPKAVARSHTNSSIQHSKSPQVTISTKAAPRATAPALVPQAVAPKQAAVQAPTLGHQHIQVATFASMAAAQPHAQKLANAGLPTRIGKYARNGQQRQVIVLGPFATAASLKQALSTARAFGHSQAITRK